LAMAGSFSLSFPMAALPQHQPRRVRRPWTASPRPLRVADPPDTVRLGMPQLSNGGLSLNWLLRDCGHRHWLAIAEETQTPPGKLRDRSGARAMASVVACAVNGEAHHFHEDDLVTVTVAAAPKAATGWRGEYALTNGSGAWIVVELLTVFARRSGQSNRDLEPADMPPAMMPDRESPAARRTGTMRSTGRALRALLADDAPPPHLSFPINREFHYNGVGLVYFANFADFFSAAEANVVPPAFCVSPKRREIHFFGNLDAGDRLDVVADASVHSVAPRPSVVVRTAARRRSDRYVVAVCETTLSSG